MAHETQVAWGVLVATQEQEVLEMWVELTVSVAQATQAVVQAM